MQVGADTPAVVTGGASGLGAATARALAAKGATVALFDLNEEAGEALAAEIGGVFCRCDVTSDDSVAAAFERRGTPTDRSGSSSTARASGRRSRPPAATARPARSRRIRWTCS